MADLTIVIPVKNEAANLSTCLQAIGQDFGQRIVVIDSGSTDETVAIAEQAGAEVMQFQWNGKFPKKRNWFLMEHSIYTRWILFLDADEMITPRFKEEVSKVLPTTDKVGFWLNYSVYFQGKRLKGGYPLRKLALFKVGAGLYEEIAEEQWSQLDMEVHEHPVLNGAVGQIKARIDHRDMRDDVAHYLKKHHEYAAWEARRYLVTSKDSARRRTWTWKQRLKYRMMNSPWTGPAYFLGSFIFMGGFRDGAKGLAFAQLKMAYFTEVYCRINELRSHESKSSKKTKKGLKPAERKLQAMDAGRPKEDSTRPAEAHSSRCSE